MRRGVRGRLQSRSAARSRSCSRAAGRSIHRARDGTRRLLVRPLEAMHPELRPLTRHSPQAPSSVEHRITSVELHRNTSRPPGRRQACGLGDPAVRIDPDRGAVLGDHEVGAGIGQPGLRRVGLDQREPDARLIHQAPRRRELRRGDVDAGRPRPELREPGREVRGAAAELDDVQARDVAEDVQLGLVDAPDAPRDLVERPVRRSRSRRCIRGSTLVQSARFFAASSDQPIREPDPDLALGRLGRIGAVDEVVRHRERELAAERARVGIGRVRRADRLARSRDRALALEHERQRRAEVMKSTSSPKNGFSLCSA